MSNQVLCCYHDDNNNDDDDDYYYITFGTKVFSPRRFERKELYFVVKEIWRKKLQVFY